MENDRVPPHNFNSLDPSSDPLNTIVKAGNFLLGRNEEEYLELYPLELDPSHTGHKSIQIHYSSLHLLTQLPIILRL